MATLVSTIVDTDGTGDYSSLNAAEADNFGATGADLVTNEEYVECDCQCTSGSADTTAVTIDGFTTDSTRDVKVWCDPESGYGHQGVRDNSKYRVITSSGGDIPIVVSSANVTLAYLQGIAATYADACFSMTNSAENALIDSCYAESNHSGGQYKNGFDFDDALVKLINSVVFCPSTADMAVGIDPGGDSDVEIYNNTVLGYQDAGIFAKYGIASNNLVYLQSTGKCFDGNNNNWNSSSTNNATSDALANNGKLSNGLEDISDPFVDLENGDSHLTSGSDPIGAGTDLSAEMDAVDITGETRPQGSAWDIGAFEYVSSGGITWNIGGVSGVTNISGVDDPAEIGGVS